MGVISTTKPDAWTLSPQATAAPELWRGMVFMLPMWDAVGAPFDIVTSRPPTLNNSSTGFVLSPSGMTFEFSDDSPGGLEFEHFDALNIAGDITVFMVSEPKSGAVGVWQNLLTKYKVDGTVDGDRQYGLQTKGSDNKYRFQVIIGRANKVVDSVTTLALGRNDVVIGVRRGETLEMWVNGVLENTTTGVTGNIDTGNNVLTVAQENKVRGYPSFFSCTGVSSRAWSPPEIRSFNRDPFAMLRPAGF